jgi:hypothetical protein
MNVILRKEDAFLLLWIVMIMMLVLRMNANLIKVVLDLLFVVVIRMLVLLIVAIRSMVAKTSKFLVTMVINVLRIAVILRLDVFIVI